MSLLSYHQVFIPHTFYLADHKTESAYKWINVTWANWFVVIVICHHQSLFGRLARHDGWSKYLYHLKYIKNADENFRAKCIHCAVFISGNLKVTFNFVTDDFFFHFLPSAPRGRHKSGPTSDIYIYLNEPCLPMNEPPPPGLLEAEFWKVSWYLGFGKKISYSTCHISSRWMFVQCGLENISTRYVSALWSNIRKLNDDKMQCKTWLIVFALCSSWLCVP